MRMKMAASVGVRLGAAAAALACVLAGFGAAPALAAPCQGFTGGQPQIDDSSFTGVAVISACDFWAVGNNSDASGAFIEHWTGGSSWTSVAFPEPGPGSSLAAISAVSATDIWAVGAGPDNDAPLIIHWDGTRWTQFPSPLPSGMQQAALSSVTAVSANDAWATGFSFGAGQGQGQFTLTEHWDGSRWAQVASPSPGSPGGFSQLNSVSAVSASDIWTVGTAIGAAASHFGSLIEHWDGRSWTQVPSPSLGPDTTLQSVSAASASDVWAVGFTDDEARESSATLIDHWDGSSWTRVYSPDPGTTPRLFAVYAVSASNVWAAGATSGPSGPVVLHWDGRTWSQAVAPAGFTAPIALGASAAGGLWVAGTGGGDGSQAVAEPLAQAQIAVNANAALGESGYVTQSVPSANLAAGTNPAVAVQPDGSSLVAWVASGGLLWTLDSAGNKVNTRHQVAAGTSPAVATLAGDGFAVLFHSAGDDSLRMLGPNGSANALGNGPAVAAGTSPAIAGDGNGGFEAAYHAAGTDHAETVTQAGAVHDTDAVMAAGASPAITTLAGSGYEAVYPAASGALTGIGPDGTARPLGSGRRWRRAPARRPRWTPAACWRLSTRPPGPGSCGP